MSSRKRPLAEISHNHSTPVRYAISTPHTLRERSQQHNFGSAKQPRSARSAVGLRHVNNNTDRTSDTVRPDGSARNILRQFAKITAPITKKVVYTPDPNTYVQHDKENENPDEDDDSILLKKPIFAIEDSIEEEEDSELPVPPTPSVLPDDFEDDEQPTVTFARIIQAQQNERAMSEKTDRRRSRVSFLGSDHEGQHDETEQIQEGDATIMTERGRRAVSEEATGRFSRYSFGSIRMSDFGTELEIERDSNLQQQEKMARIDGDIYDNYDNNESADLGGETEDLRMMQQSPVATAEDEPSMYIPGLGDETFHLRMPDEGEDDNDMKDDETSQQTRTVAQIAAEQPLVVDDATSDTDLDVETTSVARNSSLSIETATSTRRQTLLENAVTTAQTTRRKRLKLTQHGTTVPSLPSSFVKRVAVESQSRLGRRKPKFGRDHLKALEQATEWYFEQLGEDLAAYSGHGRRRKRVDGDDVLLLMRRQKVLARDGELAELAKQWLPKEILKELDLPSQP